jgi:hypothetical protein
MKYIEAFLEEFKKTPAFTFKDVQRFLESKGSKGKYTKMFIGSMLRTERAYRITNGSYSLYRDIEIVGFPFYPFYYGLGFALTYHGFWKQQASPHVITTRKVRVGT